jgi:deoxyribose-phosphate aldolase
MALAEQQRDRLKADLSPTRTEMSQTAMTRTRLNLAAMIDHTLLKPETTAAEINAFCDQAVDLSVYAVCISPTMVGVGAGRLRGSGVKVAAVIGFPAGAHRPEVKADEAARAVADGTDEADMVINLGLVLGGEWDRVTADIAAVRSALTGGEILKVTIESALLTPEQIFCACRAAEAAGADFVDSSTGFHPVGGATVEAIEIMSGAVGGRLGVKAAGGIHDAETAFAMIDAGATRLGLSASAAVLAEVQCRLDS